MNLLRKKKNDRDQSNEDRLHQGFEGHVDVHIHLDHR